MNIYSDKVFPQVRDSDPTDTKRERVVQLIDDFKISGVNGVRILYCLSRDQHADAPLLVLEVISEAFSVI